MGVAIRLSMPVHGLYDVYFTKPESIT